jgi:hypothetical protein
MNPNTMPTVATEVMFGTRMPIRIAVRARSRLLSQLASSSASSSCGTVATKNSPNVL